MGLDTVELIVETEKLFKVEITNEEAVVCCTVGDLANLIYLKKYIDSKNKDIFRKLYFKIESILLSLGIPEKILSVNSQIIQLIPQSELNSYWDILEKKTQLKFPKKSIINYKPDEESEEVKLLGIKIFTRQKRLRTYTLGQIVDYVVSLNNDTLLDINHIHNKYEVERIICMITSDRSGVPIHKIELFHSFTYDLGMD